MLQQLAVERGGRHASALAVVGVLLWLALVPADAIAVENAHAAAVHGYSQASSTDCYETFDNLEADYDTVWDSELQLWGYYGADSTCDDSANADGYGNHEWWLGGAAAHEGATAPPGSTCPWATCGHTKDTQIVHLAYHMNKMIAAHDGPSGIDAFVGYSMGGLVLRTAITLRVYAVHRGASPDTSALDIDTVSTHGTPHLGFLTATVPGFDQLCTVLSRQCSDMAADSYLMRFLHQYGQSPWSEGGRISWALLGSAYGHPLFLTDAVVAAPSAVGMHGADNKVVYITADGYDAILHVRGLNGIYYFDHRLAEPGYTYQGAPLMHPALAWARWWIVPNLNCGSGKGGGFSAIPGLCKGWWTANNYTAVFHNGP